MKKSVFFFALMLFFSRAHSQDSSYVRFRTDSAHQVSRGQLPPQVQKHSADRPLTPAIYRDTRLGSSSPLYDSYIKNNYGAGAITTNPNKWGSGSPVIVTQPQPRTDTVSNVQSYNERKMQKRDQRP